MIEVRSPSRGPGYLSEQRLKTSRGIRIRTVLTNNEPYLLVAKGRRYRSRPQPSSHRCDYCGMNYLRGDPEENASHLSYHAKARRVLDPWPKKAFVEALKTDPDGELVHARSPMWKHHEMFERARQFKREMLFDFIQWGKDTHRDTDPHVQGFLLADTSGTFPHGSIVGACAFRMRQNHWELDWIWIAPKARRKGILKERWPGFLDHFGDFRVSYPLSDAMQAFIQCCGTPSQRVALCPVRTDP